MKVRDIMTQEPKFCGLDTNIAAATEMMWSNDCGVLPVVEDGKLAGIITDRDICIALGTRNRPAADTTVKDVATGDVQTCTPDDDVHTAMAIMRRAKVRRLPVVSDGGVLEGIIALNDIVLAADRKHGAIDYDDVMDTVKAVSEHRGHKPAQPAKLSFPPIAVAVA
jgi:CBS domain-containing protein